MAERRRPSWHLDSPIEVTGLRVGGFLIDASVAHGLKPGTLTFEDRPRVVEITRIARADGQDLGDKPITVDLRTVAIDSVIWGSNRVLVQESANTKEGFVYVGRTQGEAWRSAARVVRQVASEIGGSRWTTERDSWLMKAWQHIDDHGCATQADLAAELGIPVGRISDRLRVLRKRYGVADVPLGRRGRPSKGKDEQ